MPIYRSVQLNMLMTRPLCPRCRQRPKSIAYHKYQRVYYRSTCSVCAKRAKNNKAPEPRWKIAGYKKKVACDRCGFRGKFAAQLVVFHVDGNMNNTAVRNLKTICQNCVIEIAKTDLPWRAGDLEPDV